MPALPRRRWLVGLVAAALAAAAGSAAGVGDAAPGPRIAEAAQTRWVGRVTLTYSYSLARPAPGKWTLEKEGRVVIRAEADGTVTADARYKSRSDKIGMTCGVEDQRLVTAEGWFVGPVRAPSVSFDSPRPRYRVEYTSPGIRTRVTTERNFDGRGNSCPPVDSRVIAAGSASVPTIPAEGTASRDATSVHGSRTVERTCARQHPCREVKKVTWSLRRVTTRGADEGGGTGGRGAGGSGSGSGCRLAVTGTADADRLAGTAGSDLIAGLEGDDVLSGGPGADCLYGDEDDDQVLGEGGNDVLVGGEGVDMIDGGPGNDVVAARDGFADVVRCGSGRDTVEADPADRLVGCERRF